MTQEEKQLLLTDLCSRLPYGVKCNVGDNKAYTLSRIEVNEKDGHLLDFIEKKDGLNMQVYLSEAKPYLFPLSSMTPKQKSELSMLTADSERMFDSTLIEIDFYHKNHFDYGGLIPMGLANDATGLNIY